MQQPSLVMSILAAAVVLLIPGGALLAWSSPRALHALHAPRDPINDLIDACALSLSITALVGLVGNLLGLRFSGTALAGLYGLCAGLLIAGLLWRALSASSLSQTRPRQESRLWLFDRWIGLGISIMLLGSLVGWRAFQARDLALPVWVDSVHHTLVVRVILENGVVPSTLDPYLPVPLVFHYGFHLSAALFGFWSGASPAQAVLWFGQLLNALVALAVYRMASVFLTSRQGFAPDGQEPRWRSTLRRSFPLVAALLVGFGFQMPGYYLTWGRFTLLAGLLMIGPAIAAAMDAWDDPARVDAWLRLTLLITGLALTHIFTLVLVAIFLALLGLAAVFRVLRRRQGWNFIWRMAAFSLLGLLLAAPWLAFTLRESPYDPTSLVSVTIDASEAAQQRALDTLKYISYLTGPRRSHILLGLSSLGLLAELFQPRRRFLACWAVLLALSALPWGQRAAPFRADYFAIILFFPAALLLASVLVDGALALSKVTRGWLGGLVLVLLVGAIVGWGIRETRSIINPVTVIATQPDVLALEWVRQHTPPDARFYINSTTWQTSTFRGVDGGYWLEPDTGRMSLIPPVFYVWGDRPYVLQINDWAKRSAELQSCGPDFWAIVREANLTYVYVREGTGSLQPAGLVDCAGLQEVYQAQGVHIYQIQAP